MGRFRLEQEVSSVVAETPEASRVFERHGIDYCCGGKIPLEQACARRGIDPAGLLSELEAVLARSPKDRDWSRESVSAIVDHVLFAHHAYVMRELPRLIPLMEKVNRVHGANHPDTIPEMALIWARVACELEQHLRKEEEILFPMILALGGRGGAVGHCGDVDNPIRMMEEEHEEHGKLLARMRRLANGYVPPEDACGSWRALWSGLDEFEKDLHMHIHLENNILFPRARALADAQGA